MRPVERGPCPRDAAGNDVVFNEYSDSRPYLITRMGDYCSFCEMQVRRGSDRRYQKRREAWQEAVSARDDLRELDTPETRKWIVTLARARGFWSVWMTVFRDDDAMRAALLGEAFPGTAAGRVLTQHDG